MKLNLNHYITKWNKVFIFEDKNRNLENSLIPVFFG
jgi:hypothetical protein